MQDFLPSYGMALKKANYLRISWPAQFLSGSFRDYLSLSRSNHNLTIVHSQEHNTFLLINSESSHNFKTYHRIKINSKTLELLKLIKEIL